MQAGAHTYPPLLIPQPACPAWAWPWPWTQAARGSKGWEAKVE